MASYLNRVNMLTHLGKHARNAPFQRTVPILLQGQSRFAYCAQRHFRTNQVLCKDQPSPRVRSLRNQTLNSNKTQQSSPLPPPPSPPPPPPTNKAQLPEIVVGSIIAICAGVFMWHGVKDQELKQKRSKEAEQALEKFDDNTVLSLKNIREGRHYTILTSTFAHTSPVHLFVNMMTLWSFGPTFIYVYGLPAFALVYAGAGIAGGALQLYAWSKSEPQNFHKGLGASGSLLGVLAAWACVMPREPIQMFFIPMKLGPAMGIFAVASSAFIYTGALPFIGHWDHLGGMAFGAFWWLVALRRGVRIRGRKR